MCFFLSDIWQEDIVIHFLFYSFYSWPTLQALQCHHGDGHRLAAAVLPHATLPAPGTAAGVLQETRLRPAAGDAAAHLWREAHEEGCEPQNHRLQPVCYPTPGGKRTRMTSVRHLPLSHCAQHVVPCDLPLQNRLWQRDHRDFRAVQPDAGCYNDVSVQTVCGFLCCQSCQSNWFHNWPVIDQYSDPPLIQLRKRHAGSQA